MSASRGGASRSWASSGLAAGLAITLLALGYFAALAPYGLNLDDEGTLIYQIYRTYLGQVLYVDFHAGYTPGLFYWNAALFSLFGVNVLALRFCLALINAGTVGCMYWLARRLGASWAAAGAAGLMYVAFIPYYDGQFAAFNIPYPIWYVTFFWLVSLVCVVRWWETGRSLLWLPAGVSAGIVFAFKPNSGLLDLAALLITLTVLERPAPEAGIARARVTRVLVRLERLLRWLIPWVLVVGLSMLFRGAGWREVRLFAVPLVAVVTYQLIIRRGRNLARAVAPFTLWRNGLILAAGFSLVTLPWAIYFGSKLGTTPFLRAVLFIGTDFDKFYFIGYPPVGTWGVAIASCMGIALAVGLLVRRRYLPPRLVTFGLLVGFIGAAAWLSMHQPPMVEGFQNSVLMRVRDISFVLVLVTEWAALAAYLVQTWRGRVFSASLPRAPEEAIITAAQRTAPGTLVILVVSGILMHMQLYPRTDFMHLVTAVPGILILGAWLLDLLAQVWARGIARTAAGRALTAGMIIVPFYVIAFILMSPALARVAYLARVGWKPDSKGLVSLDNERAPLLIEPAAGRLFRTLSSTARYLRDHARRHEFVFTFPVLDIVCFLSDRQNPTRHGYFFPGWPGHAVEAEVVDALSARPPRYIVTLHDHALYFATAPVYYFNLRQFITRRYTLERRIGTLDILRVGQGRSIADNDGDEPNLRLASAIESWRAELQQTSGAVAIEVDAALAGLDKVDSDQLAAAIAALDPAGQRALALLIRKSRSAEGVAALAIVLENHLVLNTLHELFIRVIAESGDIQSIVPLVGRLPNADPLDRNAIAGLLFTIGNKLSLENYWCARPDRREWTEIGRVVDSQDLMGWIDNPWELFALRSFAVRVAGREHDRTVIPFLLRVLGDSAEYTDLRVAAADSLVELGFGPEILPSIARLLRQDQMKPAALLASLYERNPEVAREQLAEAMGDVHEDLRAAAFWVAATVRDAELLDELQEGLHDRLPEVRMAAAWGLGNLDNVAGLAALQRATHDGNDEVATVAQRAALHIGSRQKAEEQSAIGSGHSQETRDKQAEEN